MGVMICTHYNCNVAGDAQQKPCNFRNSFLNLSSNSKKLLLWILPFPLLSLNPPPPLRFFADSEKTAARSAAKFAIAVQPTIWHISKKTTTRWPQRSRDQVAVSDLTSSCVFRSLTSCQRHTSDPNSLKLTMYSKSMGVYNLYISDFLYRWP